MSEKEHIQIQSEVESIILDSVTNFNAIIKVKGYYLFILCMCVHLSVYLYVATIFVYIVCVCVFVCIFNAYVLQLSPHTTYD